jgi:hypothetical protein
MAAIDFIQVTDNSQNQSSHIEQVPKKRTSDHRIERKRMDFGGYLTLTKSGRWIYIRGSGKTRITKSTKQKNYDRAVHVARRMHLTSTSAIDVTNRNKHAYYMRLLAKCRRNAKTREIEFNLTADDMMKLVARSNGVCELTGMVFQKRHDIGFSESQPFIPSIDRIDSYKGYSFDNCRLICLAANLAINSWGDWVLMDLMRSMQAKYGRLSSSNLENLIAESKNRRNESLY